MEACFLAPEPPTDNAAYEAAIEHRYGDLTDRFLSLYPADGGEESVLAATRDALYGWTAERLVIKQEARGVPAYLYLFDHGYPAASAFGLHAFHAAEVPYVFGTAARTTPLWPRIPDREEERRLSRALGDYWAAFARTGDPTPSDGTLPAWLPFVNQGYQSLQAPAENTGPFSVLSGGQSFNQARNCTLWLGG